MAIACHLGSKVGKHPLRPTPHALWMIGARPRWARTSCTYSRFEYYIAAMRQMRAIRSRRAWRREHHWFKLQIQGIRGQIPLPFLLSAEIMNWFRL